jgi:hypothetical protein
VLAVEALLHVRAGHVIEHQRRRQRFQERAHLVEVGVLEIDHDVPAELGDARGDPLHHVLRRGIDQPLDEVEAHALDARVVQLLQAGVGDLLADEGTALGLAVGGHQRIDQRAVVGVMAGRLHDHVLVEAEEVAALRKVSFGASHGVYLRLGANGKHCLRPEHVAVRVDRARRRLELRLRRIGMERI